MPRKRGTPARGVNLGCGENGRSGYKEKAPSEARSSMQGSQGVFTGKTRRAGSRLRRGSRDCCPCNLRQGSARLKGMTDWYGFLDPRMSRRRAVWLLGQRLRRRGEP